MASFNIFGSSVVAQTLASGENGFVGTSGNLVVSGAQAVTLSGSVDIVVLGAIVGLDTIAIGGTITSADVMLGAGGQVISSTSNAIGLNVTGQFGLSNAGLVSATVNAVELFALDGAANTLLSNSGIISGAQRGIVADLGTGAIIITNSGVIESAAGGSALLLECSGVSVVNTGTILGNVLAGDPSSSSTIRNTGTIQGNVTLNGAGELDTRGGSISGSVTGGNGNNIYRIDDDAISISDFGTIGTDTIFSSVSYAITAGIERLALTGARDVHAIGGSGFDRLDGNSGDNRMSGADGGDAISGGAGDDTLRGGAGDDLLIADAGDDNLIGGSGTDVVAIGAAISGATVNLAAGTASGLGIDDDTLAGIENVLGGVGNDTITGSLAANVLSGMAGDDILSGGGGNDTLAGSLGADTLTGGNGADVFQISGLGEAIPLLFDTITDFRTVQGDLIDLSLIDPDPGVNNAFVFNGPDFLPLGLPSVRVFQDVPNNQTIVEARDTSGTEVDIRIVLTGLLTLTASDFLL